MTALATIGHNAPSPRDLTGDLYVELADWLKEHPALTSEDEAKAAARLRLRTRNTLADVEDGRKANVRPLNDQVKTINAEYGEATAPLQSALVVLNGRLTDWELAEELRRQEIAEKIRLEAKAAQERASEAIRNAQEAEQNASFGETVDVVGAKQAAVAAFNDARRAERAFLRAERDGHVKLSPGLGGRAMGLRSHEELAVTDPAAVIAAVGLTEGIAEALITAARHYRKERGQLPPGIASNRTRTV